MVHSVLSATQKWCVIVQSHQHTSCVCVWCQTWHYIPHSTTEVSRNKGGWQHFWPTWFMTLTCCICGQSELNSQCSLQNHRFKFQDLISFTPNLTTRHHTPPKKKIKSKRKEPQQSSTRMATTGQHNAESSGNSTSNLWQSYVRTVQCQGVYIIYKQTGSGNW
jgi:hypothetical protein